MEAANNIWNDTLPSVDANTLTKVAILVIFSSLTYVVSSSGQKHRRGGKKLPPCAPGGMCKHIRMCTSAQYPWWLLDVARELQTRVFQLNLPISPTRRIFAVGEPSTVRAILTDPLSTKPEHIYRHMRNVWGGSPTLFTLNGSNHHRKRKALASGFSSNQVKRMTRVALEKTEAWIKATLTKNESFDVSNEMVGVVLSAISETAFEYEMSAQEKEFFGKELELALVEFTQKSPSNPLRTLFGLLLPARRRAFVASKKLQALVTKIMNEYRKNEQRSNGGTLIQLIMESEAFPTDDEKAAQLVEFLIAGYDTTAYSIAWVLLNLARNPEEQSTLRRSLARLPPENWSSSKRLQRVIKEGMRVNPVASAGSVRTIGRDVITSRNEVLPKGSICFLPFMLLFRNSDVFEEPDSFLPSRWENPSREMSDCMNPFALGKQNCVGQSLAKAETFAIVARICSEFELIVESEGTVDFFLTLKPVGARLRARRV